MSKTHSLLAAALAASVVSGWGQAVPPGLPEENGLLPKTDTLYLNLPSAAPNNTRTESLGVAITQGGRIVVGWEDDGDGLTDLEAVWTLYDASGAPLTPETGQASIDPAFAAEATPTNRFLSFFRANGTATPSRTAWGPKIQANQFGPGFGMGATAFDLGLEVAELAGYTALGEDWPAVQVMSEGAAVAPVGIANGMSVTDAQSTGNVRIGDWGFLSNGNIVIVGESRQDADLVDRFGGSEPRRHIVYRVVTAAGAEVKPYALVSAVPAVGANEEMWHGVGVTRDGFAIRWKAPDNNARVRLFDNTGNPVSGNLDIANLPGAAPGAAGGGRGDGVGFHGNGKDAYVLAAASGPSVVVSVINTNGTLRFSRDAAEGLGLTDAGRVDAAIDPNGRVLLVFSDVGTSVNAKRTVQGRLLKANGDLEGPAFYISEREQADVTLDSSNPRVAWRNDLAAVIWESRNHDESNQVDGPKVVAMRLFSTFKTGSAEAAGLTRIVADRPVIVPAADTLGNWEPNASVVGTSTFLIEGNTFAEGSSSEQRFVVALQPAAGGAMRLAEGFYADNGQPHNTAINLSRQNGNPGRVAGDKRPGATNYIVGGEVSAHGFTAFQSNSRWTTNAIHSDVNRYGGVQTFGLAVSTLTPTPLANLFDAVNGQNTGNWDGASGAEVSRFGGDVAALDNGNFVVVIDDKSNLIAPARSATAAIISPTGQVVKPGFAIDSAVSAQIWANVAAFRGGFCVRFNAFLYFFDNNGNLLGKVDQATSGTTFPTGRGDGERIFGHINSPYLYLAARVSASVVKVAAWDARDRSFVALADVSEPAFPGTADRVNGAVDALNRLTVAWVARPVGYAQDQVAARVLRLDPAAKTISPVTPSFFAFVNNATNNVRSLGMSVAMTTRQICIAAKGEINLANQPEAGADSPREINFFTVLSHPQPADDPTPPAGGTGGMVSLAITQSGNAVTISWPAGVTGYTLESKTLLSDPSWTTVPGVVNNSVTVTVASGGTQYYRLRQ